MFWNHSSTRANIQTPRYYLFSLLLKKSFFSGVGIYACKINASEH